MESAIPKSEPRGSGQALIESIISLGTKAFDPAVADGQTVTNSREQYSDLIQRTTSVDLLPALNVLIQPGRVPEWLRTEFVSTLALLPLRPDGGVRATLEFVFSVHPSSAAAATGASEVQRQGAGITLEALKLATQLLASPPARATADDWFRGIAPQLLQLLDGHDGFELAKVAAYVIGFGILGRKSFGAPGTPGWRYFAEPILSRIDPTLSNSKGSLVAEDDVIDLRRGAAAVLVKESDVSQSLRRLQTLVISHPNPGLTRRLLGPLVLPLWALASWLSGNKHTEDEYGLPARNLLKIYLRISFSVDKVLPIIQNLLFNGIQSDVRSPLWAYMTTQSSNSICIVSASNSQASALDAVESRWQEIEPKCNALLDLLDSISTDDDGISSVFLKLFTKRMEVKPRQRVDRKTMLIREDGNGEGNENPLAALLESSVLQRMMERFPERLARRPQHILELVQGLLADSDSESTPVLLSLLNLVITSPGFRRAQVESEVLTSIEKGLERVGVQFSGASSGDNSGDDDATASTARNLLLFLRHRDEVEGSDATAPTSEGDTRRTEDRKTHRLAMAYIMQADAPAPVRAEGLNLLQGLIRANSAVLDIPALLVLLSSLLNENEDYVNLRVIQMFALLADRHPRTTTQELLDHYVDAGEAKSVDARLRFGEALLQVVQRLGETFTGETAQQVGRTLLATAGRRGHRAKTAAKQAREDRKREKSRAGSKEEEEEEEDNDDDDDVDEIGEIRGIVEGWGSKKGSEDVRIRASALSVLAVGIETNVSGLGATTTSAAVDLCLHILAMEPDPSMAIVRRAAIVLILSFVRSLHEAREARRRLGFGLTQASQDDILRILRYVAGTDNDGLVRQHATDVIESLENWQLTSLLPVVADEQGSIPLPTGGGLPKLAGLSLNPGSSKETTYSGSRIEEVE